jgi:UDP-N-acetylglucosamine:LPS N-acetylglucosamine transferase
MGGSAGSTITSEAVMNMAEKLNRGVTNICVRIATGARHNNTGA